MAVGDLITVGRQDDNAFSDIPQDVFTGCLFEVVEELPSYLFVKLVEGPAHPAVDTWRRNQHRQYVRRDSTLLFASRGGMGV